MSLARKNASMSMFFQAAVLNSLLVAKVHIVEIVKLKERTLSIGMYEF